MPDAQSKPLRPVLRVLLHLLFLVPVLCASCASTGGGDVPEGPAQVTYRQYSSGVTFSIVNESHTNRLEKYSTVGADASVKVASDEVMAELLKLEGRYDLQTQSGSAPATSGPPIMASFEIEDGRGLRHALLGQGSEPAAKQAFSEYQLNFLALFNNIYAPQAVEADENIFDDQSNR